MSIIHCCVSNKCTGTIYGELVLNCKFCKNRIFLQCMRNRDEGVKSILMAFGLGTYNSTGRYGIDISDTDKIATFYKLFSVDSPFAVTCEVCADKFNKFINVGNTGASSMQQNALQTTPPTILTSLSAPQTSTSNQRSEVKELRPPVEIQHDQRRNKSPEPASHVENDHKIYISKFHHSTKCNDIADFISKKTSLQINDGFSVKKLFNKKFKPKSFVSFLVTASSSDNYEILMNEDLWGPEFTATRFITKNSKKSHQKAALKPPILNVPSTKQREMKPVIGKVHVKRAPKRPKLNEDHEKNWNVRGNSRAGSSQDAINVTQHGKTTNISSSPTSSAFKQHCRDEYYGFPGYQWPQYYGNNFNNGYTGPHLVPHPNFYQGTNHMPPFRMPYPLMFPYQPQMFQY